MKKQVVPSILIITGIIGAGVSFSVLIAKQKAVATNIDIEVVDQSKLDNALIGENAIDVRIVNRSDFPAHYVNSDAC